jgi:hypothetical protein
MRKGLGVISIAIAGLLAATTASATLYNITAPLGINGAQETPPVVTAGTATISGTYDDVTNILIWSGSFSGLTGTTTDAHFHGPAAVGAGPAGILVATNAGSGDILPTGVTSGLFSGSATVSATVESHLLNGLVYWNLHSTFKTGGEIRGQIALVPEPATLGLLGLGLVGLASVGRRRS